MTETQRSTPPPISHGTVINDRYEIRQSLGKGGMGEVFLAYDRTTQQPVALNYLGYAQLERRENVKAAMSLIEQASALKPDDPSITDSLGWAHYLTGDVHRAIPALERAVQGQPSDATINEHLGDAYWAAGRRYEARYAWSAAAVFADTADIAARAKAKAEGGFTPALAAR